jgi:hypothetical protein
LLLTGPYERAAIDDRLGEYAAVGSGPATYRIRDLLVEAAWRLVVGERVGGGRWERVPDQLTLARALRWARSAVTPTA